MPSKREKYCGIVTKLRKTTFWVNNLLKWYIEHISLLYICKKQVYLIVLEQYYKLL